jgi:CheY-like chemotaxis protein/anti-sigma regulatory factor (Ser/Thr protein kinase)
VVNDVLDFSKIDAGKLVLEASDVVVTDIIDRAVMVNAARAHAKGLDFLIHESRDLPERIVGDPLRIAQVLVNLLSNAIKFTRRGHVALEADWVDAQLVLRVIDTGVGIDGETQKRLFSPFEQADGSTTRKFGGTGLGLAITKRLVEQMGGSFTLISTPEVGSCFEIRLPAIAEEPGAAGPAHGPLLLAGFDASRAASLRALLAREALHAEVLAPGEAPPSDAALVLLSPAAVGTTQVLGLERARRVGVLLAPGEHVDDLARIHPQATTFDWPLRAHRLRMVLNDGPLPAQEPVPAGPRLAGVSVLAAEDNEFNRLVLAEILELEGARLVCAEDGIRALEALRRGGPGAFDILLTDIQMPEMDGFETTRRAREMEPELPVVGLTAFADTGERERCLSAGMVDHVAKPIDHDRLIGVILRHARCNDGAAATKPASLAAMAPADATGAAGSISIDWAALDRRFRGKQSFIKRLLRTFHDSHTATPAKLRELAATGAPEAVQQIEFLAHGLKGTCGTLGATAVESLAHRTQLAARAASADTPALAGQLADALDTLIALIQAHQEAAEKRVAAL